MALNPGVPSISGASKHRIQRLFKGIDNKIDLIADGSVHSVLVVDDDRKLVGIATDTDLLDYLCS